MYWIMEEGDGVMGFTWDLLTEENGHMVRIGSFYGKPYADRFLKAIEWYESGLDKGKLGFPEEPKKTRKKRAEPIEIVFTPAKKKGNKK